MRSHCSVTMSAKFSGYFLLFGDMSCLSQCRTIAGPKAFVGVRRTQLQTCHGVACATMKKKEGYLFDVEVASNVRDPEEATVRTYRKKLADSRVIEQLRARRHQETPRDELKRRTRERISRNKSGFIEPTFDEVYGSGALPYSPFQNLYESDTDYNVQDLVDLRAQQNYYAPGMTGNEGGTGVGIYSPRAVHSIDLSQQQQGGYIDGRWEGVHDIFPADQSYIYQQPASYGLQEDQGAGLRQFPGSPPSEHGRYVNKLGGAPVRPRQKNPKTRSQRGSFAPQPGSHQQARYNEAL